MAELVEHTTKAAVEEKAKLQKHFERFDIFFFLMSAELGSSCTEEGRACIWVKLAFRRFVASINSVFYWLSNSIWLGGTLTILAVTSALKVGLEGGDRDRGSNSRVATGLVARSA